MKLSGKNIAITGATQGLGFAIARECLREGANIRFAAVMKRTCGGPKMHSRRIRQGV